MLFPTTASAQQGDQSLQRLLDKLNVSVESLQSLDRTQMGKHCERDRTFERSCFATYNTEGDPALCRVAAVITAAEVSEGLNPGQRWRVKYTCTKTQVRLQLTRASDLVELYQWRRDDGSTVFRDHFLW